MHRYQADWKLATQVTLFRVPWSRIFWEIFSGQSPASGAGRSRKSRPAAALGDSNGARLSRSPRWRSR